MAAIAFFGSPAFAVPCLDALVASNANVVGVFSQPDRPAGRGQQLRLPPVKAAALRHGLTVLQPTKMRDGAVAAWLTAQSVDLAVIVAYGRILPTAILQAPRLGCVNVHASLLPRWRGASPIQRAIAAGDQETGVCLMQMDEGLDTGPVLARARTPIMPDESADQLAERLANLGAKLLVAQLDPLLLGQLAAIGQVAADATYAPLLTKGDGAIDWTAPAAAIYRQIRAMTSWPGAYATLHGENWKVYGEGATVSAGDFGLAGNPNVADGLAAGTLVGLDGEDAIFATGAGTLRVLELQRPGRRRMGAGSALRGARFDIGDRWDIG